MRNRNMFNRIRHAVRSVETGTAFARGNASFSANPEDEDMETPHKDALIVPREGIVMSWRLREEILREGYNEVKKESTENNIEEAFAHDYDELHPLPCKKLRSKKADRRQLRRLHTYLSQNPFDHQDKTMEEAVAWMKQIDMWDRGEVMDVTTHKPRHSHNFGRKSRHSTRETIRHMRQLPQKERMIAGELLQAEGEDRRARRRARQCKRPLAEIVNFPTRTNNTTDESVAA